MRRKRLHKRERMATKTEEVVLAKLGGDSEPGGITRKEAKKILRRAAKKSN